MNPLFPASRDPDVVALAGDWHGNMQVALNQITRAADANAEVLVHLGDFGFWRDDRSTHKYISRVTRRLEQFGMQLLFVDGNHEDHDRLRALPVDPGSGLRKITNHVWHLPRGFRWTWSGTSWMAVGGAVSVDRAWRREGKSWWPEEVLSATDVERTVAAGLVDVIVTHDCPSRVGIPGLRPSDWPADALADADAHRDLLLRVVEQVRPRRLWHGHYHVRYRDRLYLGPVDGRPDWDGVCLVAGLADDAASWQDNITLVDTSGTVLPWPEIPNDDAI